jgi:hypothetical protein
LGGLAAALLLTLFAFHIGDCHVSSDDHRLASATRTVEIAFGLTTNHRGSLETVVADGGAKQHAQVALAMLLVQQRIPVVQHARSVAPPFVGGKNTALAHRKLTSLLI